MKKKVFFLNSAKEKLAANLYDAGAGRCVIFSHGLGSTKDRHIQEKDAWAQLLNKRGITALFFDFSGCGESQGEFEKISITKYLGDLKAAIGFMAQANKKIGLAGSSLGAAVTLAVGEHEADALFCIAPPTDFKEVFRNLVRQYRIGDIKKWEEEGFTQYRTMEKKKILRLGFGFYRNTKKYKFEKIARNIKKPVMIVHGETDDVVPIRQSENLMKFLPSATLQRMQCGHIFLGKDFMKMAQLSADFFDKNL